MIAQAQPLLAQQLHACDVVWSSPSVDATGSMPIGNGEVVLNVWVEQATGDLMFLIGRTDSLSEISRILKLGRLRVHLASQPLKNAAVFDQRLDLYNGRIDISGGGATLALWVSPNSNTILVEGRTDNPTTVTATLECWRNEARPLPEKERGSAWSVHNAPFPLVESGDVFLKSDPNAVTWYHRNETTIVPQVLANQSLTGLKGTFDPILHRTFGGRLEGKGFVRDGDRSIVTPQPTSNFEIRIPTLTAQTKTANDWVTKLDSQAKRVGEKDYAKANANWWNAYWNRCWVFVQGDHASLAVPKNDFALREGVDSNGKHKFPGRLSEWRYYETPFSEADAERATNSRMSMPLERKGMNFDTSKGFTLTARIGVDRLEAGRIFDKVTAGKEDGSLFDTDPGDGLRLQVGRFMLKAPHCLTAGQSYHVAATYDAATGEAAIYMDGKRIAHRPPVAKATNSPVTSGYMLQRYVQACQGRGEYPIKFNGGYYTVEPIGTGLPYNPDFRNWGDCHWYQNVRHMYHPMLASGDYDMMEPFFRLYENVVPLAESRSKLYHDCSGAYFPETMTDFGTYSGGDYGWDRRGKTPADVDCKWWQYAWNQGPELVAVMLDRWDFTRDEVFLKKRVLPMATAVLQYFDTRFKRDAQGKIVLDPAQSIETYWYGVVNDMPTTAGLIDITNRLCALPSGLETDRQRAFFEKMKASCPDLPLETKNGVRQLSPAQKFKPETSNVENPELYAVWPFPLVSLNHPSLMAEAKAAYATRLFHQDFGWGQDGNIAALLGMTDEAARILEVKCANSHPAYRWPATWGPNYDWLPDQNHGGNLLETTELMLLQSESLENGGVIRVLPSWPKEWDVDFKLHARGNTTVHCVAHGGRVVTLEVTPASRAKDVVLGEGWTR